MYEFRESDAWDFARQQGIEVKQNGNELHFKTCPYCRPKATKGNIRTFSINLRTGQFKCLRASCGVSGNMLQLSRDFDFSLGNDVDEYYKPKKKYRKLATPKEPIKPKAPAVAYLEKRGISEEVAKAYEITVQNNNENVLVFPFYDEKGILQFVKYRKTDFDPERDKNKEWCEKDCKPILFGMKQCNIKHDYLIITEGQMDSLSVVTAGIENAVSVPTGAMGFTWVPYCFNWVSKFKELVVFGDFEKGKMSLLEDIKKRFPNKIKQVREEDYKGCKDANEILVKHGPEAVRNAVLNAEMTPIKSVISLADVESVNIYKLKKVKTGIVELDRTLYGGLPFGMVCIVAGKRGDGKSTFASQIVANAIDDGLKAFVYSGELPNYLYKSWFDFQIAGPHHIAENVMEDGYRDRFITTKNQVLIDEWYRDKAFIFDSTIIENEEQVDLLQSIKNTIMQHEVKVILIDNLMTAMYLDEQAGSDKYEKQGRFVRELTKIALQFDVLVILIAHRRKNSFTSDANDEISGSGDISNLAGITLSYDRGEKKDFENGMDETQRKLIVAKNRLFGKINLKGIVLSYDEKSKRIYGEKDDLHKRYGWLKDEFQEVQEDEETPFD